MVPVVSFLNILALQEVLMTGSLVDEKTIAIVLGL
jgi:hypothetical protein